ncbi:MAG: hypothetical protein ACFFBD_03090 [Candidatus Hodarchaeota archaeon]
MKIRQRARSWFNIWLYQCSLSFIIVVSLYISLILGNDAFFLLAAHGGAVLAMVGIQGLITWIHREYLFFPTNSSGGRVPPSSYISIPKKADDRYWLYKDPQLEIFQAGNPRFIEWGLVINGLISLVIFGINALMLSWDLNYNEGRHMLPELFLALIVVLTFVIILIITAVLSIRLFRDYVSPPRRQKLRITVWAPFTPHFQNLVSFKLNTQVIEMRQSSPSLKGFVLPIGSPIQLQFASKTIDFTLNPEDPLPQILNEVVVVIKDWTILNR